MNQSAWRAQFDLRTSAVLRPAFEGDAGAAPQARRGYCRDHRPDCKQLVPALVATPKGHPLTCEISPRNRRDRATPKDILDTIERKSGQVQVQLLSAAEEADVHLSVVNRATVGPAGHQPVQCQMKSTIAIAPTGRLKGA